MGFQMAWNQGGHTHARSGFRDSHVTRAVGMSRVSRRRLIAIALTLSIVIAAVQILYQQLFHSSGAKQLPELRHGAGGTEGRFLVNTPGCKIPDVDPFDASIRHLIMKSNELHCNATPAITFVEKNMLRINRTALKLFYTEKLDNCLYQSIHRPTGEASDDLYYYGNESRLFHTDVYIPEDFIRVACYGSEGSLLYTNFHAFVHRKLDVEKKCQAQQRKQLQRDGARERRLNVIIVGVDSVSRLNFIRQMPKTRRFLLKNLNAVELLGYNKVADNTYVNLVPMFAGKFVDELPWDETMNTPFDSYNFIWKNFSESGYRTLYAEDAPKIAIFNYAKEGFHKPPADYYLRPFSLAMEDHGAVWNNNHDCVGPRLETQVVLDYMLDFLQEFQNNSYYAFSFITRLTHDGINKVGAADAPYHAFLTSLYEQGHLGNSVLIFFSDHGMRFGSIRETHIGKLEERLPFMLLVLPQWFKDTYPRLYSNLRKNRRRLTTPFDIYETLKNILHPRPKASAFPSSSKKITQRGISLFSEIPTWRTCDQAGILEHWCTCHDQQKLALSSPVIVACAQFVVEQINKVIARHRGLCAELFLQEVIDGRRVIPSGVAGSEATGQDHVAPTSSTTSTDYMLTLRTHPGNALYEATVRVESNAMQIIGELSRINAYGDSGSCVQIHSHMKFCHCQ